jgi:D-glycero-D-manno-heptose 1,7-bisphosphate phosphatase
MKKSVPSLGEKRAVFVDRDGVVNRAFVRNGKPYPPSSFSEFELLPGVANTLSELRKKGFLVIVVTNQPDIGTGLQAHEVVEKMHQSLRSQNLVDDIKVCTHIDNDACSCRKPKPGMLTDAALRWDINLKRSYMVGDRWRDVAAGKAAGCYTFFIDYAYLEQRPDGPDMMVSSLEEAGRFILNA